MSGQNRSASLTEGNVYRTLITFAIPFLLANFIQALYGAVDMAVIGWFSDAAGIAAVSVGTQIMQSLNSLITGLTLGGTILIAQYLGAGQKEAVRETIGTTLTLFALAAVAFTAVMLLFTTPLLRLLQTPEPAMEEAVRYVAVASCGIFFIFGYNALGAVMRGVGDSKSPLLFIAVACCTNIVLDLLFVGGMGMGAGGAALATILSQGVSMILAILYLGRKDFIFSFRLRNFRIRRDKALRLLRLGLPVSLQETMVTLSFLFIAAIVNSLGVTAAAAVGVAGKFEGFAMLPANAFSGALASLTAQNMGANRPDRARQSLYASIGMAFVCSLFFFAWAQLAPDTIMHLFKADEAVTIGGGQYLRAFSYDFMLVAFVFCFGGFFNGCGCTGFTMLCGILSSLAIRLPLSYVFTLLFPDNLSGIGASVPIASFFQIIVYALFMRSGRWKRMLSKQA